MTKTSKSAFEQQSRQPAEWRRRRDRVRRLKRVLSWLSLRGFPWRIAGGHFGLQISGFVVGLALTVYLLREGAVSAELTNSQLDLFDQKLTWVFTLAASLGVGWFFLTTYWAFRPLSRVLRAVKQGTFKARPLGEESDGAEIEELFVDEPGEWAELERSVGRLAGRIKDREVEITREREELVTILSSVNDAIVAMGKDTEPLYFNSRFAVLFGAGGSLGAAQPLRERFRVPELLDGFNRVLQEGRTRTFRVRMRTELHLNERDFSISVSPLFLREAEEFVSPGGRPPIYGAVAIFHDISELKQTEQMRMDFVANASHELKTPLTSIKGYVDAAKMDLEDGRIEEARGFLDVATRNVDRLMALVYDLLELATLESGAEVKKSLVSPQEVTEATVRMLEGRHRARHRLRVECSVDRLLADPRRIEQVLTNLIDNAMKYSPEDSEIRIVWEPGQGANSGDTVLRVRDSGPGISDEHLPRLFERFYRVDAGRAREVGGTGLGLAIVKHIVLSHGGSIAVRSKIGEGSEFLCRFPNK
ncbi:MAG: PAS domain-containing sensor histidine kinase [Bdellovibrionales bacterium]|nr:PAS domain-containing sensor histidine kinase [Bdellovibrionales bacterium]